MALIFSYPSSCELLESHLALRSLVMDGKAELCFFVGFKRGYEESQGLTIGSLEVAVQGDGDALLVAIIVRVDRLWVTS